MAGFLRKFRKLVRDALFPLFCLGCEKYGAWLCSECAERIPRRDDQQCPLCRERATPWGERCFGCSDHSRLDGLFACSTYQSSLLSCLIHTFKYQYLPDLARPLGMLLIESLERTAIPLP